MLYKSTSERCAKLAMKGAYTLEKDASGSMRMGTLMTCIPVAAGGGHAGISDSYNL